jgi:hypothetical protein
MTWSVSGLALCLGLALACAADTASATTINPMGQVSPAGSATTTLSNWGRGYEFTVDAADVVVTQLGYVTPGAGSCELALWEVSTGTKIASRQGLGGTA